MASIKCLQSLSRIKCLQTLSLSPAALQSDAPAALKSNPFCCLLFPLLSPQRVDTEDVG